MLNPIKWYFQRRREKRMMKELCECLFQVARAMDDFGDVIIENSK